MISVQHLTYEYPDTKALDDVSFTGSIRRTRPGWLLNKRPEG
ncbi:MAG: hypothetical protein Q3M24_05990 [Candidatus Electrothrix aestuarii]|uniref:Uncharacterized protein n=1 Tax=Candidatus Electrothrix aestuarii TaxID=3062594 RepID=A0AAU8LZR0_9BACT|nr:hypothetical protein [Candidatus Electrothrix aestuarii]